MLLNSLSNQTQSSTLSMQQTPQITMAVSLPQPQTYGQPQQQISQNTISQNLQAPSKPTDFEQLQKIYQERAPLTKSEQLDLLMSQTNYQRNKVHKNFLKQITVRKTQYLLIDALSTKVNSLFQKFGLNERNIEYQSEELLRLKKIVQKDRQKESSLFKSALAFKEFHQIQFNNYLALNSDFQSNKNVFDTSQKIEAHTISRQSLSVRHLLQETKPQFVSESGIGIRSLVLNTHNQLIIEKLFFEQGFTEMLLSFFNLQKFAKTAVILPGKELCEKLFNCFVKIKSEHKDIMRLLSSQFQNIDFQSETIQNDLIQNSVHILESELKEKIGILDLGNLNCKNNSIIEKFKDIYLEDLSQHITIKKEGHLYPSGILFLLMRCGQLKNAKSILFQFLRQQKFNQFFDFLEDKRQMIDICISLKNQEKLQQLQFICDDDLFLQCCYLAFDSGEVNEIFEKTHFQLDQDLFLWMTLKTTHSKYEEKNDQNNWLITDLQEAIPKNIGFRMDILILRYDEILLELFKNCQTFLSKMECLTIFFVIEFLLKDQMTDFKNNQIVEILNSSLEFLFEKYPEFGGLIIMVIVQDTDKSMQKIQQQMIKQKYNPEIFQNQRFNDIFDQILGDAKYTSQIMTNYLESYFEKNLIQFHTEFMINGMKQNNLNTLLIHHKTFIDCIDQSIESLKNYIKCVKIGSVELATELYYLIGIVLAIGECQFYLKAISMQQGKDQSTKGFQKNTYNPKQYYNFFTIMYSQTRTESKQKQLFNLLQAFNYLIQSIKIQQFDIIKFRQFCILIDISKLSQILIQKKQSYLLKLFFWLTEQQLELQKGIKYPELKQMKDQYSKVCSRSEGTTQNRFYLLKEEINLNFSDIQCLPQ